ncbi:MAG: TIGR00730 family Rossman fold protein [Spirosomataceae bacterium]
MQNICVFCGSSSGHDPVYRSTAEALGTYLGTNGHRLIYGGGNVGLMGTVADATLASGGEVIGVIPDFLRKWEVAHDSLTDLLVTDTMHERKMLMAEQTDAVVTLPGGFGTLDELFEMLTWKQLRLHQKPIGLLNVKGYYNPLLQMIDQMVSEGFLKEENQALFVADETIEGLFHKMQAVSAASVDKWVDKSKI